MSAKPNENPAGGRQGKHGLDSIGRAERLSRLEAVHSRIRVCRLCPLSLSRTQAVPGEGPLDAQVMFVGEAPGRFEDLEGRPFVGPSGRFLDTLLESIGLRRSDVFITGSVKCRPPGNRRPKRPEIDACHPYLREQIEIIRPRIIVLLGEVALEAVLGIRKSLRDVHGSVIESGGHRCLVTYHPAAGMRFPRIRESMAADFELLRGLLENA